MSIAIADRYSKINSFVYKVGNYIRLSREDLKVGESESISNQRTFLKNWVKEQGYELVDTYVDDGFSGTNFERPAFQRMIEDIESGKINMVVTKDLSRLGRDYIETGNFLERYFPENKIRYVAVTDGIDTAVDSSNNDMAPFKAVYNDMYAKDISKKIRTALRTKQKEGLWVGGCPPLGYMQDPNDKNHLVPDPEEDFIIKKIFSLALQGKTNFQIRTILTEEQVPTRAMIKGSRNNRISHATSSKDGIWSTKTVKCILQNQLYTGDMVQNRRSKVSYKIKKTVWNDEKDWIIVENTHEPLVSKEDFDIVQKMLPKNSMRPTKKVYRLLDGLLYCYECNHKIGICAPRKSDGRTYIVCNYYRINSKYNVCTSHGFNYDYLEEAIMSAIKKIALNHLEKIQLKNQMNKIKFKSPIETMKNNLELLEKKYNKNIQNLDKMYLDKIENKITEEMYDRVYEKINIELKDLEEEIKNTKKSINESNENSPDIKSICEKILEEFISMKNPTRDMMLKLIDKIYIHKDKEIDIYFNFKELNLL